MFFWCHRLDQKTNEKIWQNSALESKKWTNQQNKGTILQYYALKRLYNTIVYIQYLMHNIIRKCLSFVDLTTF